MDKYQIDWEEQWAFHAPGYSSGYVHIDLAKYSAQVSQSRLLRLKPGPGFGDLSHSTTHLALKLLAPAVKDKHVVDIGSGSGILSFAAMALGAKSVCGVEIDEEAIQHAQMNNALNGMEEKISFLTPAEFLAKGKCKVDFIVMNMIQTEQQIAWKQLSPLFSNKIREAVTSGIWKEGREEYLRICHTWGWTLHHEMQEGDWLGFYFRT